MKQGKIKSGSMFVRLRRVERPGWAPATFDFQTQPEAAQFLKGADPENYRAIAMWNPRKRMTPEQKANRKKPVRSAWKCQFCGETKNDVYARTDPSPPRHRIGHICRSCYLEWKEQNKKS